jgi:hypothetical protein
LLPPVCIETSPNSCTLPPLESSHYDL